MKFRGQLLLFRTSVFLILVYKTACQNVRVNRPDTEPNMDLEPNPQIRKLERTTTEKPKVDPEKYDFEFILPPGMNTVLPIGDNDTENAEIRIVCNNNGVCSMRETITDTTRSLETTTPETTEGPSSEHQEGSREHRCECSRAASIVNWQPLVLAGIYAALVFSKKGF